MSIISPLFSPLAAFPFGARSLAFSMMFGKRGSFLTQRCAKPCLTMSALDEQFLTRKRLTGFILCFTMVYRKTFIVSLSSSSWFKPSKKTCLKLLNRLNLSIAVSFSIRVSNPSIRHRNSSSLLSLSAASKEGSKSRLVSRRLFSSLVLRGEMI